MVSLAVTLRPHTAKLRSLLHASRHARRYPQNLLPERETLQTAMASGGRCGLHQPLSAPSVPSPHWRPVALGPGGCPAVSHGLAKEGVPASFPGGSGGTEACCDTSVDRGGHVGNCDEHFVTGNKTPQNLTQTFSKNQKHFNKLFRFYTLWNGHPRSSDKAPVLGATVPRD